MQVLSIIQNGFKGLSVPFVSVFSGKGGTRAPARGDTLPENTLDLIYGHLRTHDNSFDNVPFIQSSFAPLKHDFLDFPNWYIKSGSVLGDYSIIAKVQPFKSGGYETTFTW